MRPLPRRKFIFDKDKMLGVYGISIVENPANDFHSVIMSKQHQCNLSHDDIPTDVIDLLLSKGEKIDLNDWELLNEKVVDDESVYNINLASLPPITGEDGSEDNELFRVRYEYTPSDVSDNSREFCVKMAKSGLTFRKEDLINSNANPGFGPGGSDSYNIFFYKGGVNCRHSFTRKIYLRKNNKKLSVYEALQYISGLDKKEAKKAKFTPLPPEVSQKASSENNYWKLSKQETENGVIINCSNDEKRILITPVLVPQQNIYRNINGEEFYGYFEADDIYELLLNYQKNQYNHNTTIDHKEVIDNVFSYEHWIVENPKNDKANELGFEVPKGTWMCSIKCDNDTVWNDYVKTGKITGVSIDSILAIASPDIQTPQKNNFQKMNHTEVKELVMKILMEQARAEFKISEELSLFADKLEKDMVVYDKDQAPYASQEFTYEGKIYKTDENGVITEISEEKPKDEKPVEDKPVDMADVPPVETPSEPTVNVDELKAELDKANQRIQDLEAENSSLKAELTATKEEALNLSKQSQTTSINLSDTAIYTPPTNQKRTNQEVIADFLAKNK